MQIVLGMALRRFELALPDGVPLRAVRRGVTIVPSGGARMRVARRVATSAWGARTASS
jgi:cytochrome P450